VLDPRISYVGLKNNCSSDKTLLDQLETAKEKLQDHFNAHYANLISSDSSSQQSSQTNTPAALTSTSYNLLAGYDDENDNAIQDELDDYFCITLKKENWTKCDPIMWWHMQRHKFPNLSILARNLLAIPGMSPFIYLIRTADLSFIGSAVAVERVFSGGRDTISLRRASLMPETIRTLMVVKASLKAGRAAAQAVQDKHDVIDVDEE
jgi:hypothetical protein